MLLYLLCLSIMSTTEPVYKKRLSFWGDWCRRYQLYGLKLDYDCFWYLGPGKQALGIKIWLVL